MFLAPPFFTHSFAKLVRNWQGSICSRGHSRSCSQFVHLWHYSVSHSWGI